VATYRLTVTCPAAQADHVVRLLLAELKGAGLAPSQMLQLGRRPAQVRLIATVLCQAVQRAVLVRFVNRAGRLAAGAAGALGRRRASLTLSGQAHGEQGAALRAVACLDTAAIRMHDGLRQGQAQAEAGRLARARLGAPVKRSNRCGKSSTPMPGPASATPTSASSPSRATCTLMVLSGGENFTALSSRLASTRSAGPAATRACTGAPASNAMRMPRCAAAFSRRCAAARTSGLSHRFHGIALRPRPGA
jgi:hypothetical protein